MFEEDLRLLAQELRLQELKARFHLTPLSVVAVLRSREPQLAAANLFSNSERVSCSPKTTRIALLITSN